MNYLNFTPSQPSPCTALLDSRCTAHFLLANVKCSDKKSTTTPLAVRLPNGDTITSTHTATLNMPSLPHATRKAHVLPGLAQHSLLSVKLLPLPHPPVRARTEARTNPSAQRAPQLRSVLARVYAVSRQNQITTTVA
jgi:hypothetical protein